MNHWERAKRKHLRREYLRKKGHAYALFTLNGALLLPFLVLACASFILSFVWVGLPGIYLSALFAWCTYSCWRGIQDGMNEAKSLPYIPPVTPDTLPPDEILVRGSEEPPVAQSEVLLRAAKATQEAAKEELLRIQE